MVGKRKVKNMDWREYASILILNLNSNGPQYGGFTPGRRLFGWSPKLPIGRLITRTLKIPYIQNDAPVIQAMEAYVEHMGDPNSICAKRFPRKIQFSFKYHCPISEKRTIINGPNRLLVSVGLKKTNSK